MLNQNLDVTLQRYHPNCYAVMPGVKSKTLVDHFEHWVKQYRNMDCDKDIDYHSTRSMMRRWGRFSETAVVELLSREPISAGTYNRRLTLLKAFFRWAKKKGVTLENPLEDVLPRKTKKSEKASRKPFTEEEIRMILTAFQNDSFCSCTNFKHSHYYPFLYFIFATGVRNAEAVGLRVQHIDVANNVIHIKESLARSLKGTNASARVRKETKNGKQRVLPLTADVKEVLLPLLQNKKGDDLIFQSPKGVAIDDHQFQKRIFRKVLKGLHLEHRVLYACRHTFGSRCIQAGMTPEVTAFLMGNNPQTALRNYTHLMELPKVLPKIE